MPEPKPAKSFSGVVKIKVPEGSPLWDALAALPDRARAAHTRTVAQIGQLEFLKSQLDTVSYSGTTGMSPRRSSSGSPKLTFDSPPPAAATTVTAPKAPDSNILDADLMSSVLQISTSPARS